ncbi:Gfo/Idh/MocA family oxidoreductase [Sutcliffiella horikoshii]|uniref:Gfo/Idh/MocA family oxidoreductase n=1 Tax=Sutcliffiella horikoshii TaxID=79883 RepID=A0AA94WNM8_9BACI|nr:Gfo/Idh/MocA family oxidoreductase [Sutcliffiella horikoshii]TYS57870.1 Gfo/Idh/MocA family oxidoreductase [Sutcliffiella horikoshii]
MIRFGVIGTNWITESFINAALESKDFRLTAVYSRKEETAKNFGEKFSVTTTYTDLNEFSRSNEFDAVYIASPNSLHAKQAIACMNQGKHVLCEKPIATNTRELSEMIAAAKRNNVFLMEAMKSTLLPNFLAVKENLHKIGKIRRYVASYCQYSSRYDKYKEGTVLNAFKPEFSNGALMDIGIYTIYPMVALFGKPKALFAMAHMLESGVDGQGSILFQYDGMDASVAYSKIANSYLPSEIQGEEGTIILDTIHTPEKIRIKFKDGSEEDITVSQKDQSMFYEAEEFIRLIKSGEKESSINSLNTSLQTMELIEEARKQIGLVYPADQR